MLNISIVENIHLKILFSVMMLRNVGRVWATVSSQVSPKNTSFSSGGAAASSSSGGAGDPAAASGMVTPPTTSPPLPPTPQPGNIKKVLGAQRI